MAVKYDSVHWTPHKRLYDKILSGFMGTFLAVFCGLQLVLQPQITVESLIIRASGTLAFLMLHLILIIGPLCRLDKRFLPLLYNRRHFGVSMFGVALVHGVFCIVQFHAQGNVDPLASLLGSNTDYASLSRFPFQALGFFALLILALMAATSHDYWLNNLSPQVWKTLHMGVYFAYSMLVMHVTLGVLQWEKSPALIATTGIGMFTVIGFHLAGARNWKLEIGNSTVPAKPESPVADNFQFPISNFHFACNVADIPENRAKLLIINGEHIAIFKYDGKISAVHNQCKHQGGPLSEGKILDGCITCPWHGYQYLPSNGQSPPPFKEKISTYDVMVVDGTKVFVNPEPHPPGTELEPAIISERSTSQSGK